VTGKRYRGHSGNDPGSYDPIVVYAYRFPSAEAIAAAKARAVKLKTKFGLSGPSTMAIADPAVDPVFTRIALSVNGTATIGTQIVAADFDHDGDMDFATAGKLGVHVFENLKIDRVSKAVREETQPFNRNWPFPGEGKEVEQEDGPVVPK
jgi:hypothetical protein